MNETPPDPPENDQLADREADAAAKEAGAIGGKVSADRPDPGSDEPADPAEHAVLEGGGGVSEGFEQAEGDLIEHASHGDPAPDPTTQISDEAEGDDAEHGAADHERSSERPGRDHTH
ncbi:MAG: hypothetical protein ACR2OC_01085 [Solirubrobacterales bacterium]